MQFETLQSDTPEPPRIITGVTATSGSEPTGVCDDPPTAGLSKLCTHSFVFGRQSRQSRVFELGGGLLEEVVLPALAEIQPDVSVKVIAVGSGEAIAMGQRGTGEAEWSADEIYLALPRPGGDGWVSIDRTDGTVTSEATSRGWISYLNDLHKGRNAGTVWKYFIDIFSVACFLFALTGLVLLQLHAKKRPSTWPLVAAGLALPAILAIIFIH